MLGPSGNCTRTWSLPLTRIKNGPHDQPFWVMTHHFWVHFPKERLVMGAIFDSGQIRRLQVVRPGRHVIPAPKPAPPRHRESTHLANGNKAPRGRPSPAPRRAVPHTKNKDRSRKFAPFHEMCFSPVLFLFFLLKGESIAIGHILYFSPGLLSQLAENGPNRESMLPGSISMTPFKVPGYKQFQVPCLSLKNAHMQHLKK